MCQEAGVKSVNELDHQRDGGDLRSEPGSEGKAAEQMGGERKREGMCRVR